MNKRQRDYIICVARKNLGSDTTLDKPTIIQFAEEAGLQFSKRISKADLIDLIISDEARAKDFCEAYSWAICVSGYDLAMMERISYAQIQDLEQMGILKVAEKNKKGFPLYDISCLAEEQGYLKRKWQEIFIEGYHRTRIEVGDQLEADTLLQIFSKDFEITNVSQLYPMRDKEAYHLYFSIRRKG